MNHLHRQPIRVRHETRRRELRIVRVEPLSPRMRRIVLAGEELAGFVSLAPDDHVKLILPAPDGTAVMRDYTPRQFDAEAGELTLEFVIHDHGPASDWAAHATPGQTVTIGGPRGSMLIPEDYAAYLLVGDDTALPAIARRLEELPAGMRAHVLIEVADAAEERALATAAAATVTWVHRDGAAPGAALEAAFDGVLPDEQDVHAWIGCEIETARALRARLLARGWERGQIKAAGYWRIGAADSGGKIED